MDDCRTIPEMLIKAVDKYPSKNILNYKENNINKFAKPTAAKNIANEIINLI